MQVIRAVVKRESIKAIFVPKDFGDNVEMLVFPEKETNVTTDKSTQFMQLQEQSGFVKTLLADCQEDVWNEL